MSYIVASFLVLFAIKASAWPFSSSDTSSDLFISEVSALLPCVSSERVPAPFAVQAKGGCFSWTMLDESVASLEIVRSDLDVRNCPEDAASICKITPIASCRDGRRHSWISAVDKKTSRSLDFELIIDQVHSIHLATHQRDVNVGSQEMVELEASDRRGNVFTSLEGLPFVWNIENEDVMKRVEFSKSVMEVSPIRQKLELLGKSSDRILVIGNRPGSTEISASLICSACADPISSVEIFHTTEPLILFPSRVHTIPDTNIIFNLKTISFDNKRRSHGSSYKSIAMPDSKYVWESSKGDIVEIDQNGEISALKEGSSVIKVYDVNVPHHFVESLVTVTHPNTVRLNIESLTTTPHFLEASAWSRQNPWRLTLGNHYQIFAFLYQSDNQLMTSSHSSIFHISTERASIVEVFPKNQRNSIIEVAASNIGETVLHYTIDVLGKLFEVEQMVIVDLPLKIPRSYILPCSAIAHALQSEVEVHVQGGRGKYSISSLNNEIQISPQNKLQSFTCGISKIFVYDPESVDNEVSAEVKVSEPAILDVVSPNGSFETQVGQPFELQIIPKTATKELFSNCSSLKLSSILDRDIMEMFDEISCSHDKGSFHITIETLRQGFAVLDLRLGPHLDLQRQVLLSAFNPLSTLSEVIIVVGKRKEISLQGGPLQWPEQHSAPSYRIDTRAEGVEARVIGAHDKISIKCSSESRSDIVVKKANAPSAKNTNPVVARSHIDVICVLPLKFIQPKVSFGLGSNVSVNLVNSPAMALEFLRFDVLSSDVASFDIIDGGVLLRSRSIGDAIVRAFLDHPSIDDSSLQDLSCSARATVTLGAISIKSSNRNILSGFGALLSIANEHGINAGNENWNHFTLSWSVNSSCAAISMLLHDKKSDTFGPAVHMETFCPGPVRVRCKLEPKTTTTVKVSEKSVDVVLHIHPKINLVSPKHLLLPYMGYYVVQIEPRSSLPSVTHHGDTSSLQIFEETLQLRTSNISGNHVVEFISTFSSEIMKVSVLKPNSLCFSVIDKAQGALFNGIDGSKTVIAIFLCTDLGQHFSSVLSTETLVEDFELSVFPETAAIASANFSRALHQNGILGLIQLSPPLNVGDEHSFTLRVDAGKPWNEFVEPLFISSREIKIAGDSSIAAEVRMNVDPKLVYVLSTELLRNNWENEFTKTISAQFPDKRTRSFVKKVQVSQNSASVTFEIQFFSTSRNECSDIMKSFVIEAQNVASDFRKKACSAIFGDATQVSFILQTPSPISRCVWSFNQDENTSSNSYLPEMLGFTVVALTVGISMTFSYRTRSSYGSSIDNSHWYNQQNLANMRNPKR